jgi:hypothetical protein
LNPIESRHPFGTIGIITGELSRFTTFWFCLNALQVPTGSTWFGARGGSVANNCNRVVLGRKGSWLWFMGDDHTFHPMTLLHLLDRRVDIVVPICSMRGEPYQPVVYTPNPDKPGRYLTRAWKDLPMRGMISEIDGVPIRTGQAGMLVRTHVFEKIAGPYWFEVGKVIPDQLSEDLNFCEKALAAGFKIHLDCDVSLGHTGLSTVYPVRTDEGWRLDFELGNRTRFRVESQQDGEMVPVEDGDEAEELPSPPAADYGDAEPEAAKA